MYKLVNGKTGEVVGKYASRTVAHRAKDRKDNEYGAYIYAVVAE